MLPCRRRECLQRDLELFGPFACPMKNGENLNFSLNLAVRDHVRSPNYHQFAGTRHSPWSAESRMLLQLLDRSGNVLDELMGGSLILYRHIFPSRLQVLNRYPRPAQIQRRRQCLADLFSSSWSISSPASAWRRLLLICSICHFWMSR